MKNRSYFVTTNGNIVAIAFATLDISTKSLGDCLFRCIEDNIYDLYIPVENAKESVIDALVGCYNLYKKGINTVKATAKTLIDSINGITYDKIMRYLDRLQNVVLATVGKLRAIDEGEYVYNDSNIHVEVARFDKTGDTRTGKYQVYLHWLDNSVQDTEYFSTLGEALDFVNDLLG